MQSEGLCDKVAKYYIEWSWEQERLNSLKKAEQTFKLALSKIENTSDRELIQIKHKQFQARAMKKMIEKQEDDNVFETPEEQRTVLSSLRGQGKKIKDTGGPPLVRISNTFFSEKLCSPVFIVKSKTAFEAGPPVPFSK